MIVKETDHQGKAKARLLSQFKEKPNLEAVLDTLNVQTQDLEEALFQLFTERAIDTAQGEQLDILGRIVGQERLGKSDEAFRALIRARQRANRSSGTIEEIYQVFTSIFGQSTSLQIRNELPAAFTLKLLSSIEANDIELSREFLQSICSGGIRALLEFILSKPEEIFSFAGGPGQGFGEGKFAGVTLA